MLLTRSTVRVVVFLVLVPFGLGARREGGRPQHAGHLGTVHFETSCDAPAQVEFDHAVALLHSFEFGPAIAAFDETLQTDPGCTIAYWGIALSRWGNPFAARRRSAAQLQPGVEAIERGTRTPPKSAREQDYLTAARALYADHDRIGQPARVVAYEHVMAELAAKYPEDLEASIFYALALAAAAPPSDKTYSNQLKAGAILERLSAGQPDHPGIAHYMIHSYDVPALADRALAAARRYASIAPDAPHALHMPSHTFTRLGYWQESIDTNIASAAAAKRDRETAEELHAMDYLVYAYLQTGQDAAAGRLLDSLPEVASRFDPSAIGGAAPPLAAYFSQAAIPARYALERRAWAEAVRLTPRPTPFPHTEAITCFARALGAAHTGDLATARASLAALDDLRQRLVRSEEPYWADQVFIQHRVAQAWTLFAEGRKREAVQMMRDAAAQEDLTEKDAVTPGPLAPARELLGDMLMELNRPAEARKVYLATLAKEPNRFRAVYGAARAAALSGDAAAARAGYARLVSICERADAPGRPELREAKKTLASTSRTGH
jgi:tetratricopeptide (TPR) repeat protein